MNLLLDTHTLLWFTVGDARLSGKARKAIESANTTKFVSIASWWEITIKCSLQRLTLDDPLDEFMAQRVNEGFRILPIETNHLPMLVDLPFHHRDPFDRLIICQAIREEMPVCTCDAAFAKYDVRIVW